MNGGTPRRSKTLSARPDYRSIKWANGAPEPRPSEPDQRMVSIVSRAKAKAMHFRAGPGWERWWPCLARGRGRPPDVHSAVHHGRPHISIAREGPHERRRHPKTPRRRCLTNRNGRLAQRRDSQKRRAQLTVHGSASGAIRVEINSIRDLDLTLCEPDPCGALGRDRRRCAVADGDFGAGVGVAGAVVTVGPLVDDAERFARHRASPCWGGYPPLSFGYIFVTRRGTSG